MRGTVKLMVLAYQAPSKTVGERHESAVRNDKIFLIAYVDGEQKKNFSASVHRSRPSTLFVLGNLIPRDRSVFRS